MSRKKTYLGLFFPVLLLAAGVIFRQIYMMGKELKQENQRWDLTAESVSGEISEEILQTMCTFPGLEDIWTVIQAEVTVRIDDYSVMTTVQGVDLSEYPLEVVQSFGKKSMGMGPLLAVGEDFFDQLQDRNGEKISGRQKKILMENLEEIKVEMSLENSGNTEITGNIEIAGNTGKIGYAEQKFSAKVTDLSGSAYSESMAAQRTARTGSDMGEVLGIVKGTGLYMDQEQMKQWLAVKEIQPRVTKVYMRVQGKESAEKARSELEKAGFIAELIIA